MYLTFRYTEFTHIHTLILEKYNVANAGMLVGNRSMKLTALNCFVKCLPYSLLRVKTTKCYLKY